MRRLYLLVILSLLLIGSTAQAQDEAFPVREGYVFKSGSEVIFPAGVRFQITLSRPVEDLRAVRFQLTYAGQTVNETMDLEDPLVDAPLYSEFAYLWRFPEDAVLHLFEAGEIVYEWQAVDDRGEMARQRDTVLFRDDRLDWTSGSGPAGRDQSDRADQGPTPEQIRRSLRQPYDLISANVGRGETFDILLYTDFDPYSCAEYIDEETGITEQVTFSRVARDVHLPCDPAQAQHFYDLSNQTMIYSDSISLNSIQVALVDYMTQQFYADRTLPAWFVAGLSDLYTPAGSVTLHPAAARCGSH